MKYLTVPRLQKLSAMMTAVDVGDRIVYARVEAYSCKLAGADKRAAKEITNAVESELTAQQQQLSPHSMPAASMASITPLGDLREPATRQLLVSLITTLNASYPDYDFSALRAEEFEREPSAQAVINAANNLFVNALETSLGVTGFRDELWSALEETIFLHECEIYKYEPEADSDESAGKLWSLNLFFFHRKLKKMVLLSAEAVSKLHLQNSHAHAYQQYVRSRQMQHHHLATAGGSMQGDEHDDEDEDDDDGFESDSGASDHGAHGGAGGSGGSNGGALTSAQRAQRDAEDDAMEAAEDQMLEELAQEQAAGVPLQSSVGEIAGSYVDASLLEWEQPLELPVASHEGAAGSNLVAPPYVSSPSASSIASNSTASTVRVLPVALSADVAPPPLPMQTSPFLASRSLSPMHAPQQVRLASTKSPTMRPAIANNNFSIGGGVLPSHAAAATIGGMAGNGSSSGALPPRGPQGVSLFGGSAFSAPSAGLPPQQPAQQQSALPAVPPFSP